MYVLPPHTSYRWRGERVIEPIKWMRSPHTATGGEERVIEPIKWMRSPHNSYRWRGERVIEPISVCARHTPATGGEEREHRANQVDALATHQLEAERRENHRANQVDALATHQLEAERREIIEPIKWMRSPHTS